MIYLEQIRVKYQDYIFYGNGNIKNMLNHIDLYDNKITVLSGIFF